ncbi:MAG: protein-disulfide reductase DsbD family protein [Vicinamibacterales bacterium]
MRSAILLTTFLTLLGAAPGRAQGLLSGRPTPQQASISTSSSATSVTPGGTVTLWADVTPNPKMHVYAEGAKGFQSVSLALTPNPSVTFGKASYPKSTLISVPGEVDKVPAYSGPFRIAVPVTFKATAKSGESLALGGALNYQACDDVLCYPISVLPVLWKLDVK